MFKIIESFGIMVNTESHCDTREAAERRLKMLRKRNPEITYWIHEPSKVRVNNRTKVTVTRL